MSLILSVLVGNGRRDDSGAADHVSVRIFERLTCSFSHLFQVFITRAAWNRYCISFELKCRVKTKLPMPPTGCDSDTAEINIHTLLSTSTPPRQPLSP